MTAYDVHTETREEQATAASSATLTVPEIPAWLATTYEAVARVLAGQGSRPAGPPFARYRQIPGEQFEAEAGFPVAAAIEREGDVHPSSLPGGTVATTMHVGPYDTMEPAYAALASWVAEHDGEPRGDAWEVYLSDPVEEPDPAIWRTEIVQPYRTR
jgi:effector-binding domain-containing protein